MSFFKTEIRPGEETVRDRKAFAPFPPSFKAQLDEPFADEPSATMRPPAVTTPTGRELVVGSECEDRTVVMDEVESQVLRQMCHAFTPHTAPTVRAMPAVKPGT